MRAGSLEGTGSVCLILMIARYLPRLCVVHWILISNKSSLSFGNVAFYKNNVFIVYLIFISPVSDRSLIKMWLDK